MRLFDASRQRILVPDLIVAENFWSRAKGLLGTQELPPHQALWIHRCNSVHTFFMNYAIDCVFVDSDLEVRAVKKNIRPGRLVWPVWGADSVIEMKSGYADELGLRPGDRLYVGA